jgi:hypothetical protein
MTDRYPHKLQFCDAGRKQFERIAVLLDLDDWYKAIGFSAVFTLQFAEQQVKGKTEVAYITPELKKLLTSDSKFFEALCEEGVLEWLTPLVIAKSAAASHD